MYKFEKHEGYAYIDDKDVDVMSVLQDVFDDMEFTFGNPDKEAVGFINGYPFYVTYSDCSNAITLKSFENISAISGSLIEKHLIEACNADENLTASVTHLQDTREWTILFYFKNEDN